MQGDARLRAALVRASMFMHGCISTMALSGSLLGLLTVGTRWVLDAGGVVDGDETVVLFDLRERRERRSADCQRSGSGKRDCGFAKHGMFSLS
jgi:hypothetical protein